MKKKEKLINLFRIIIIVRDSITLLCVTDSYSVDASQNWGRGMQYWIHMLFWLREIERQIDREDMEWEKERVVERQKRNELLEEEDRM